MLELIKNLMCLETPTLGLHLRKSGCKRLNFTESVRHGSRVISLIPLDQNVFV